MLRDQKGPPPVWKFGPFYHETVLKNMVEVRCDLKLSKKLKLSEKTKQFLPNKVKYNFGRKKSGPSETWSRSRPLPFMFHTSFAPKFNLIVAIFVLFSFLSYKSGKLVSSNLFYSRYYGFTFILWWRSILQREILLDLLYFAWLKLT